MADLAEEFARLRKDEAAVFRIWPDAPRDAYLLITVIEVLEGKVRPAARKRKNDLRKACRRCLTYLRRIGGTILDSLRSDVWSPRGVMVRSIEEMCRACRSSAGSMNRVRHARETERTEG